MKGSMENSYSLPLQNAKEAQETDPFTVRIRPSRKWAAINLRDLWDYRELLYFLTWRDVKVRYKQTLLGAAWAVLQPLAAMIVFWLFFGKLAGIGSDGIPYPVFAYAGLMVWTFFSNAWNISGNSLVGNSNLITKVYFPRMIIPGAAVAAGLVDFAIAFLIMLVLMAGYRVPVTAAVLILPLPVLLTSLLALGIGLWMSALNVKYRDIRYALPFGIQIWMFATPIIYPMSLVPEKWRWLLKLNPMTGIVEAYRAALLGSTLDYSALAISAAMSLAILVFAAFEFRRMEKEFADVV